MTEESAPAPTTRTLYLGLSSETVAKPTYLNEDESVVRIARLAIDRMESMREVGE